MKMIKIANDRIATYENESTCSLNELSDSRLGIGIIIAMSAFVGIWGTTCLINGLANAGSISEIGSGLITAITGS